MADNHSNDETTTGGVASVQGNVNVTDGDVVSQDKFVVESGGTLNLNVSRTEPSQATTKSRTRAKPLNRVPELDWLFDAFAAPFIKTLDDKLRNQQIPDDWINALQSYGQSIQRQYGRLRILGKSEDVPLGDVFTDVFILDQISARRRFDIRVLMEGPVGRFDLPIKEEERHNGMGLVNQGQSLYILGKPGAGKTTFLKNVAVRAVSNQLGKPARLRLPLFVPLYEWANSRHKELQPFLVEQLDTHHCPEAKNFLAHLLEEGHGLLLFDGLDEVRQERAQRAETAQKLHSFTMKYNRCQYLITCRVAASEYVFPGLRDVEMADFTRQQVRQYAEKWFGDTPHKFARFADDLKRPENEGLAELCNVPLLLSLLCLYYEDAQAFPARRVELYEDALDALLRKWDSSRQIQRDKIYEGLSPKRKQQMFAHIATPAFEKGQLYWTTRQLADAISSYLSHIPGAPPVEEIDGEAVLRAIESQHGVLVERAHNIYSFSHLSFQEYFTARYIVENEARGATIWLIRDHLTDQRWRETFLLTASLLDNADSFVDAMDKTIAKNTREGWLPETLRWADTKSQAIGRLNGRRKALHRLAYIFIPLSRDIAFALDLALDIDLAFSIAIALDVALDLALERARSLSLDPSLVRALARALDLSRAFSLVLGSDLGLHSEVGIDYALYYGWTIVTILTEHPRFQTERTSFVRDYPSLEKFCREMGAKNAAISLFRLALPYWKEWEDDDEIWRTLSNGLWRFLEDERGFLQQPEPDQEDYEQINGYFYANELLMRCLELAYVTNRQEILDNLLRPPGAPTAPKS